MDYLKCVFIFKIFIWLSWVLIVAWGILLPTRD